MALISKTTIHEVNAKMDAISIVGDYVRLEKKGGRWWGRCPFHGGGQEKTPSFIVDPEKKLYHCFGCNKGGSVISFVMEMDKLPFIEAIKNLAKKTGVQIIYEEGSEPNVENISFKEELYELYKRVTGTFQHFLSEKQEGKDALNYIVNRGFSREVIEKFKLGYAPKDRSFLFNFLKQKGYSDSFLEKSGLFSAKYKTSPLFSGRLVFPITDRQGKIVAFGGRSLPGAADWDGKEPPKYINSPETEIYKKGHTLYAIDFAKEEMRKTKQVFLAEGYMDVMALFQAGLPNSVAPLGTAFTEEQAAWLRRWVDRVVLVLDNDEAGQKAIYKGIIACRKNGIFCGVCDLQTALKTDVGAERAKKFKDPAEILQEFGSNLLNNYVKNVINDFEYLIFRAGLILEGGSANVAVKFMFPFLDAVDSQIDRDDFLTRIADIFKIEKSAVQKDFLQWKTGGNSRTFQEKQTVVKQASEIKRVTIRRNAELSLLTAVALNMELYEEFRSAMEIKEIDDLAAKEIFIALEECYKHDEIDTDSLLARIEDEALRNYVAGKGACGEYGTGARKFMEDGINKIKKKKLEKRIIEIKALMRESERGFGGNADIDDLLAEKIEIDSQIRKLEGR